jgi:hypothetical protein
MNLALNSAPTPLDVSGYAFPAFRIKAPFWPGSVPITEKLIWHSQACRS